MRCRDVTIRRYLFLFLLPLFTAGCAHSPVAADTFPREAVVVRAEPPGEALLKKAAGPAADDFIEVDDKGALRKTWPMALFIALIAAVCGFL